MINYVKIYSCGTYHPYRYRGQINPNGGDKISKAMMDFKDPQHPNHQQAVRMFAGMLLEKVQGFSYLNKNFITYPLEICIVPSHLENKVSLSLINIANKICKTYPHIKYVQSLQRYITVASAHKENGDRSIANHASSIKVITNVTSKLILLIDDVKTTGGSMSACDHLLRAAGANVVLPIALLETAVYED